jgi:hypothetical protein
LVGANGKTAFSRAKIYGGGDLGNTGIRPEKLNPKVLRFTV